MLNVCDASVDFFDFLQELWDGIVLRGIPGEQVVQGRDTALFYVSVDSILLDHLLDGVNDHLVGLMGCVLGYDVPDFRIPVFLAFTVEVVDGAPFVDRAVLLVTFV